MSATEFWQEEPILLWAYRKSYMDKLKLQNETSNHTAWLHGAYVYEAVSKALSNGFSKSKTNYTSKPYELGEVSKEQQTLNTANAIKQNLMRASKLLKEKGSENKGQTIT